MNASDLLSNSTLAILDNLSEDIRDTYIGQLPKPVLMAIVRKIWRDKDASRADNEGQPTTSEQAQIKASVPLTLRNKVENPSNAITPVIKREVSDSKRPGPFLDSPESSPAPVRKRVKTFSESSEKSCRLPSASTQNSKEHSKQTDSIILPSSLPASSATAGTVSIHLPIFLRFTKSDGRERLYIIDRLPVAVGTHLRDLFWTFCNSSMSKQRAYRLLTKYLDRYLGRPRCVCEQLRVNMRLSLEGVPLAPQAVEHGGKFGKSADDKCFQEKVPCVHIIPHEDGYAWCIMPLPEAMRSGQRWKNLHYWVQK